MNHRMNETCGDGQSLIWVLDQGYALVNHQMNETWGWAKSDMGSRSRLLLVASQMCVCVVWCGVDYFCMVSVHIWYGQSDSTPRACYLLPMALDDVMGIPEYVTKAMVKRMGIPGGILSNCNVAKRTRQTISKCSPLYSGASHTT